MQFCFSTERRWKNLPLPMWPVQLLQVSQLLIIHQKNRGGGLINTTPHVTHSNSSIGGQFGAIWDRGSLVAINPGDREEYGTIKVFTKCHQFCVKVCWHHWIIFHDTAGTLLSWRLSWPKTARIYWKLWPTILNYTKVGMRGVGCEIR